MKKIAFVLFVFPCIFFGQDYNFDYMLQGNVIRKNPDYNYNIYDMVNSKNHNNYLEISKNSITNKYYGILIASEEKIKRIYRFSVSSPTKNPIKFELENYWSVRGDKTFMGIENFSIKKVDKLQFLIKGNFKKKLKDNFFEMKVQLEKSADDLLLFKFEPLSNKQEREIIDLIKNQFDKSEKNSNYYFRKIEYNYYKNSSLTIEFDLKKVNVILDKLPQNPIFIKKLLITKIPLTNPLSKSYICSPKISIFFGLNFFKP